jgi:hypothetical protein
MVALIEMTRAAAARASAKRAIVGRASEPGCWTMTPINGNGRSREQGSCYGEGRPALVFAIRTAS